jgi:hypothetical protein
MGNFVKLTTIGEGGYKVTFQDQSSIKVLSQTSAQAGDNEGTCEFIDGTVIELKAFSQTIETLK